MPRIPSGSIDLILCDLPYGTTACKWDSVIRFEPLWREYKRIIKPRGAIVLTASQPFTSALVMSNPRWFRYEWIWKKNKGSNFLTVKHQPMKEHESVLVFSVTAIETYNPINQPRSEKGKQMVKAGIRSATTGGEVCGVHGPTDTSTRNPDFRCPSSIQQFNCERGIHPTQKPVPLFEYLIRTYTNKREIVLDNCMGSGTTGVACANAGRDFIGIERDSNYFKIAKRRIANTQNSLKTALKVGKTLTKRELAAVRQTRPTDPTVTAGQGFMEQAAENTRRFGRR